MAAAARFRSAVLDCPDPRELARFHAQVVGGTPEDDDPDRVVLRVPGGPRPAFQRSPGHTAPERPRADRNAQQFHPDVDGGPTWEGIDAAEQRVLEPGARVLDREDDEKKGFRVYADPVGHPFCLCRLKHG
ncbi:VOC family protein [Streptomyces sp. NPDC058735]|uniref:VOC family protein n=1 Tax=unclassified Streptomyces TaxID=2593676 RepID=UPI0036AE6FFB